jgi:hypothetical protein
MTEDGLFFCWRTHRDTAQFDYYGDDRIGFGMFRRVDDGTELPSATVKPIARGNFDRKKTRSSSSNESSVNWQERLRQHRCDTRELTLMAGMLGVHPESLRKLEVGYVPESEDEDGHWLFPQKDGAGNIVGLMRRYPNGKKKHMTGSKSGLVYESPKMALETLLIVEGASDVAAALTMGLNAIGRPSNIGGADLLADFLANFDHERVAREFVVVILGENDFRVDEQHPQGLWPGRDGAVHVARQLAKYTGRRIAWGMPPEGVKDLREWLWRDKPDVHDKKACRLIGRKVLEYVQTNMNWMEPPGFQRDENLMSPFREDDPSSRGSSCTKNTYILSTTEALRCSSREDYSSWESLGQNTRDLFEGGTDRAPCPKHFVPLLQGRDDPRKGLVLRVDCRTYGCSVCGIRRRGRWLLHFMGIFEEQLYLYAAHISGGQRRNLKRHVAERQDGDYLAIAEAGDRILFIANREFPGSRRVTIIEAAELVATALLNLDAGKKLPVGTSRAWAMHEEDAKADYIRRGAAPKGEFALVVKRLRRKTLYPYVASTRKGARAEWVFPKDWPAERVDWLYEDLGSPPDASEKEGAERNLDISTKAKCSV